MLVTLVVPHVTVGAVTAVPAITDVVVRAAQVSLGFTFNVPQVAVLLLPPQVAATDTLYEAAVGLAQVGAFVQVRPLVSVVLPHFTVGCVTAVPATPVVDMPVQVSWSVEGAALITNVPQVAVLLLPPQVAATDTLYVAAVGLAQVGAFVQVRPLVSVVVLHFTVGCVTAVPVIPEATKPVQVRVEVLLLASSEQETSLYHQSSMLFACQIQVCEQSLPRSGLHV